MPKRGELDYIRTIGPESAELAFRKPFSEEGCGRYFLDIGAIYCLLPQPPAAILDLGVGTGWTSRFYAQRGYTVLGQDIAPDMIALAERHRDDHALGNLQFIACDYETLDHPAAFDAAIFYDALHHAVDEYAALRSAYNALKPGGICITLEPGEGHAQAPESIRAMELYGVTERDMPPAHIIAVGQQVGFRTGRVYQRSYGPALMHDTSNPPPVPPPARIPSRLRRIASGIKTTLRAAFGPAPQIAPQEATLPWYLRQSSIVVLTK